jgi:predicted RNase H-like nuclease
MEMKRSSESSGSLRKSLTSNTKINSGVYKTDFISRAKAYGLEIEESDLQGIANRIKSTYEVELRYMREYITLLKRKTNGINETVNEKKLRDEISNLLDMLKNEQQNNLRLMEKINKNYESTEFDHDLKKSQGIREEFKKNVEDCLGFYVREMKKTEEKAERLELNLELMKKSVKVIKSVLFANYKKDLYEKNDEIKEKNESLNKIIQENENLKEKIKEMQKDVHFYQEENRKQRQVIQEISEENEIERKALNTIQKIKAQDIFSFEKDEFYSEMIEKVPETCENCERLEENLKKHEKTAFDLNKQIEKISRENKKLTEDNENLELITSKMQEILITNDSEKNSTGLFSPRRNYDSIEGIPKEKPKFEYKNFQKNPKSSKTESYY